MDVIEPGNPSVFGYLRRNGAARVLVLANFSEREQSVSANEIRVYGLSYGFTDLVTGDPIDLDKDVILAPYRFMWLVSE